MYVWDLSQIDEREKWGRRTLSISFCELYLSDHTSTIANQFWSLYVVIPQTAILLVWRLFCNFSPPSYFRFCGEWNWHMHKMSFRPFYSKLPFRLALMFFLFTQQSPTTSQFVKVASCASMSDLLTRLYIVYSWTCKCFPHTDNM